MAIKTAYISKLGRNYKVSPHFSLEEIASKDGADKVLYSEELLAKLEELRAIPGGDATETKILTNSFYRSPAHNKRVGGATNSNHTKGLAADIKMTKGGDFIPAKLLCCLCQDLGFRGVAYINENSVHLDMSDRTYRGDERKGYSNNVGGDFYKYFGISKAQVDALKVKKEDPKESEEEEMIYTDITEVPEWAQAAVQLRLDHGWTDGKNITESMVRCWVIEDRENPYIKDIGDVPTWAVPEVQALIDVGKIKGNGVEQIGKRWQVLESVIIGNR